MAIWMSYSLTSFSSRVKSSSAGSQTTVRMPIFRAKSKTLRMLASVVPMSHDAVADERDAGGLEPVLDLGHLLVGHGLRRTRASGSSAARAWPGIGLDRADAELLELLQRLEEGELAGRSRPPTANGNFLMRTSA